MKKMTTMMKLNVVINLVWLSDNKNISVIADAKRDFICLNEWTKTNWLAGWFVVELCGSTAAAAAAGIIIIAIIYNKCHFSLLIFFPFRPSWRSWLASQPVSQLVWLTLLENGFINYCCKSPLPLYFSARSLQCQIEWVSEYWNQQTLGRGNKKNENKILFLVNDASQCMLPMWTVQLQSLFISQIICASRMGFVP